MTTYTHGHAEAAGFGVIRDLVGHGIGEAFHPAHRSRATTAARPSCCCPAVTDDGVEVLNRM